WGPKRFRLRRHVLRGGKVKRVAKETGEAERLERYLQGELSEAEEALVEARYFSDDEAFDLLMAVESDLLDRWARKELSEEDQARLEARFRSPRAQARLGFARALAR